MFASREVSEFINLEQPFAVLMAAVLHHLNDDEEPQGIVDQIKGRLPSGSYVLVGNLHDTGDEVAREFERSFIEGGLGTGRFRPLTEQRRYFDGLEMVEPGLVPANEWRPDEDREGETPTHPLYIGGLGRKP